MSNQGSAAALVLFAHGSRDPQWAAPFRRVQDQVAAQNPGLTVELAFLEMMEPDLPTALGRLAAEGKSRITVAPLFMAQGAHLKRDLKRLLDQARARDPGVELVLLPAAGEAAPVLDAITQWVSACAKPA